MKEILRSVSEKGQVTLPLEVRKLLGIEPRGKVAFQIDSGEVKVKGAKSPLEEIFQSVEALNRDLTVEEMVVIATEEHAQEAAKEGL